MERDLERFRETIFLVFPLDKKDYRNIRRHRILFFPSFLSDKIEIGNSILCNFSPRLFKIFTPRMFDGEGAAERGNKTDPSAFGLRCE